MFWRGSGEVPERFLYKREYNSFLDHSTEFLRKWTLGTDTVIIAKYISTCECNRISFEASLKWICWVGLVQSAKKVLIWCKGCSFSATNFKSHFYPTTVHILAQPIFLLHHRIPHMHTWCTLWIHRIQSKRLQNISKTILQLLFLLNIFMCKKCWFIGIHVCKPYLCYEIVGRNLNQNFYSWFEGSCTQHHKLHK